MLDHALAQPATVLVVQRRLPHYRVAFFEALRSALAAQGFALKLAVGDGMAAEASRADGGQLSWAEHAPCQYWWGGRLCWQNALPWVRQADLVVLTQENKLLLNWWLLLWRRRWPRVALWGHGRDFQAKSPLSALAQRAKAWLSGRADWWFAYTHLSAKTVQGFGFAPARITTLNNSVDTAGLRQAVFALRGDEGPGLRSALGLGKGPVGLYLGSLYADKKVDLLLSAARQVRRTYTTFELVIAGAGPEQAALQRLAADTPWVHFIGQAQGARKLRLLATADLMLCPGAAGLGLVESFACSVPMVVGDSGNHGPEIAYLLAGQNGLLAPANPDAYAAAITTLLDDRALMQQLRQGCDEAAARYTQEAMVQRFCEGVQLWYRQCSGLRQAAQP